MQKIDIKERMFLLDVLVNYIYIYIASRFMGLGKVVEPCRGCYILLFLHLYLFYMHANMHILLTFIHVFLVASVLRLKVYLTYVWSVGDVTVKRRIGTVHFLGLERFILLLLCKAENVTPYRPHCGR